MIIKDINDFKIKGVEIFYFHACLIEPVLLSEKTYIHISKHIELIDSL